MKTTERAQAVDPATLSPGDSILTTNGMRKVVRVEKRKQHVAITIEDFTGEVTCTFYSGQKPLALRAEGG